MHLGDALYWFIGREGDNVHFFIWEGGGMYFFFLN